jgi:hypothetical protein
MVLRAADEAKKKAQESWRKKDREVHDIAQVNVRVPIRHKAAFMQFGDLLRKSERPREAFAGAFPGDYAALLRAAKQRNQEQRPGGAKDTPAAPAAGSASAGRAKPKRRAPSAGG